MKLIWILGGGAVAAAAVMLMSGPSGSGLPGTDDDNERTGPELYRGFWILIDNDGVGRKRWTWDIRADVDGEPDGIAFGEGAAATRRAAYEAASMEIDAKVDA